MDILDFKWRQTGQQGSIRQVEISFRLVESNDQSVLVDDRRDTSARQILFPDILASLTAAESQQVMNLVVESVVQIFVARKAVR